jgi:hypothetical protein
MIMSGRIRWQGMWHARDRGEMQEVEVGKT